jgi:hypothetical protein
METLVIHTENHKQLEALKALVKSWGISFEKYPYNPAFVAELKNRETNIEKGKTITIKDPKNIWESIL